MKKVFLTLLYSKIIIITLYGSSKILSPTISFDIETISFDKNESIWENLFLEW
jgi:hypothetical protein